MVFHSDTDRLVEIDTNESRDVFVHFRDRGVTNRVVTRRGFEPDGDNFSPRVARDGGWIVFTSRAMNMIDDDLTSSDDVFLLEIATGELTLCTVDESGTQLIEGGATPTVSNDGRFVAFVTQRNKTDPGTRRDFLDTDILIFDREAGVTTNIFANDDPAVLTPCSGLLCPEAPATTRPRLSADGCLLSYVISQNDSNAAEFENRCSE